MLLLCRSCTSYLFLTPSPSDLREASEPFLPIVGAGMRPDFAALGYIIWIKSVSWEYNCDEECLEEFNKGKMLKYSLLLAVLPRNRIDPSKVEIIDYSLWLTQQ